jgi:hypothetical protein
MTLLTLLFYLAVGLGVLWPTITLASFVKKKTGNTFLSAVAGLVSAYLLLECALVLVSKLGR